MKVTIHLDAPALGNITLESPLLEDNGGIEGRAAAAAALHGLLAPRFLSALDVRRDEVTLSSDAYEALVAAATAPPAEPTCCQPAPEAEPAGETQDDEANRYEEISDRLTQQGKDHLHMLAELRPLTAEDYASALSRYSSEPTQ